MESAVLSPSVTRHEFDAQPRFPEAAPLVAPETASHAPIHDLVSRAQSGEAGAVEALLEQFRPLLRSKMHLLWSELQEHWLHAEWADVESQVHLLFLTRLHAFRPEAGVYFPHYVARMMELDGRAWLRRQRQRAEVPFSQLVTPHLASEGDEWEQWLHRDEPDGQEAAHIERHVERAVGLREAMDALTDTQRIVVWQCCVLGRTEAAMAQELDISRSAVRNRLSGALARLRTLLGDDANEETESGGVSRTGRVLAESGRMARSFWMVKINMAKDEKRPDLVGVGAGQPVMLQGVFDFEATGLKTPRLLSPKLCYTVPPGYVLGIRFFRAGVVCDGMVCLSTVVNGQPHRLVPVAPNSTMHVNLAIVEPIVAGSQIEIHVASQASGTAIIDVGCLQMPA